MRTTKTSRKVVAAGESGASPTRIPPTRKEGKEDRWEIEWWEKIVAAADGTPAVDLEDLVGGADADSRFRCDLRSRCLEDPEWAVSLLPK